MEKTFEEKIHVWNSSGDKTDALNYYWSEIFPEVLQRAKARAPKHLKKYDCLISLVGFAPPPIVLTIKILEPNFVLFLYTKDTQSQLDVIVEQAQLKLSRIRYIPVSGSETQDVYGVIKQLIAEYQGKNIAVDISGGKKSMVGGAAIAGALAGCDIFYVDFSKYDKQGRQPIPGSEYLNFLSNPFEVFGDLELEKGKRLFNEGNYYAASQIFSDLLEKIPNNDEAVLLHHLSLMFKDWDEYNFEPARAASEKSMKQVQRCKIYLHFADPLQEKQKILEQLISGDALTLILNHYFTCQRMAERNRFDFAAFLLYRTVEMAFATRLKNKYDFDVNHPDYAKLGNMDQVHEQYYQAGRKIHKKGYPKEPLPKLLSFMNAYQLLFALKDAMAQVQDPGWVKHTTQVRNKSVFAHGTRCITEQEFQKSYQCFIPFLDYFVAEYFDDAKLERFEDKFCFFKIL